MALSLDDYYRDTSHLTRAERRRVNYDEPAAFALDAFVTDLRAVRRGGIAPWRRYDFATGAARTDGALGPADIVLAEGLFALLEPRIAESANLRILLEGDDDRLLERRVTRDGAERAYSPEEVEERFRRTVIPSQRRFLRGAATRADLQFPMDWDARHIALAAARLLPSDGRGGDTCGRRRPRQPRKGLNP